MIGEPHCTVSLFLSIDKGTFIISSIFVFKLTMTFEHSTLEFTYVCAFGLSEVISSFTVEFAVYEFALIIASILPLVATCTFLLSKGVLSFVFHCLLDDFSTLTVLSIFFPSSIIGRVLTLENTMAICLIISPFTLVQVSVSLSHATNTRHKIVFEHAFVDATILHFKFANSILTHLFIDVPPLSVVYHAISNLLVEFNQESFLWTICEFVKSSFRQKWLTHSCS